MRRCARESRLEQYVTETVGLPDARATSWRSWRSPGATRASEFEAFSFTEGVEKLEDLKPGMKLPGIVTNVTAFGAFVDIGVHQDGLVHVSQLADRFVKDPAEVVKVQQQVMVTVLEVDLPRQRIALSMKTGAQPAQPREGAASRQSPTASRPVGRPPQPDRPAAKPRPSGTPFSNAFSDAFSKRNRQ